MCCPYGSDLEVMALLNTLLTCNLSLRRSGQTRYATSSGCRTHALRIWMVLVLVNLRVGVMVYGQQL